MHVHVRVHEHVHVHVHEHVHVHMRVVHVCTHTFAWWCTDKGVSSVNCLRLLACACSWGGRGRAGLVGSCMLSLLRPDLDGPEVLRLVQAAYDTRAGAGTMPGVLKRSPQTEEQRRFVKGFVSAVRASRRLDNDMDMKAAGMPGGYT